LVLFFVALTYQKMHASFHVEVELGNGRLKFKRKRVLKCFDLTKENYNQLFKMLSTHALPRLHI
jgi:hypothetical protein